MSLAPLKADCSSSTTHCTCVVLFNQACYLIEPDALELDKLKTSSDHVLIGGFHAISGDTNNNGEMNKCWWTNKTS